MFWRNPSAAFFNFLLPLLFLALFGAIFGGNQSDLDVIVPGIAGHERDVDDVHRARLQHHVPARAGRAQAHPRHAAADAAPTSAGIAAQRGHQHRAADRDHHRRRARLFFGIGWPKDWLELVVFVVAGVVVLRVARRRALARDPELRRRAGLRQRRLPAGDLHLRRLLRRRQRPGVPARHRRGAAAQAPDRRAVAARWSPARGLQDNLERARRDRSCGRRPASCSRSAASAGSRAGTRSAARAKRASSRHGRCRRPGKSLHAARSSGIAPNFALQDHRSGRDRVGWCRTRHAVGPAARHDVGPVPPRARLRPPPVGRARGLAAVFAGLAVAARSVGPNVNDNLTLPGTRQPEGHRPARRPASRTRRTGRTRSCSTAPTGAKITDAKYTDSRSTTRSRRSRRTRTSASATSPLSQAGAAYLSKDETIGYIALNLQAQPERPDHRRRRSASSTAADPAATAGLHGRRSAATSARRSPSPRRTPARSSAWRWP